MRIYDCFMLNRELDVLEIRLNELADAVDRFVIVEARETHSGLAKPLSFDPGDPRFVRFADRVDHVVLDGFPAGMGAWEREAYQRDAIMLALGDADPDDLVIVSDADEIPRATACAEMRAQAGCRPELEMFGFVLRLYYFHLNYMAMTGGARSVWPVAVRRRLLDSTSATHARLSGPGMRADQAYDNLKVFKDAGWHFSYLGDTEGVLAKLAANADQGVNVPELRRTVSVTQIIRERRDLYFRADHEWVVVPVDATLPRFVTANRERFRAVISAPTFEDFARAVSIFHR